MGYDDITHTLFGTAMKTHFLLLAQYNAWINNKICQSIANIDNEQLWQDNNAFFGSILGTLNHIMVGDLIWLNRLQQHASPFDALKALSTLPLPTCLEQVLYTQTNDYIEHRQKLDNIIKQFVTELTADDLEKNIVYRNTKGLEFSKPLSKLLLHLFNHQTHHRGQATTLLNQMDIDIGATDLLLLID